MRAYGRGRSQTDVRSGPEAYHMTSPKGVHRSPHQGPGRSGPPIEAHQARLRAVAKRPRLGTIGSQPGGGLWWHPVSRNYTEQGYPGRCAAPCSSEI